MSRLNAVTWQISLLEQGRVEPLVVDHAAALHGRLERAARAVCNQLLLQCDLESESRRGKQSDRYLFALCCAVPRLLFCLFLSQSISVSLSSFAASVVSLFPLT